MDNAAYTSTVVHHNQRSIKITVQKKIQGTNQLSYVKRFCSKSFLFLPSPDASFIPGVLIAPFLWCDQGNEESKIKARLVKSDQAE